MVLKGIALLAYVGAFLLYKPTELAGPTGGEFDDEDDLKKPSKKYESDDAKESEGAKVGAKDGAKDGAKAKESQGACGEGKVVVEFTTLDLKREVEKGQNEKDNMYIAGQMNFAFEKEVVDGTKL